MASSDDSPQFQLDRKKRRHGFEKAAETYDVVAVLQQEIGDRLLQRLDYIKQKPARVLDLGSGTGYISKDLLQRYSKTRVIAVDIAINMLKKTAQHRKWLRKPNVVCAAAEALPFNNDTFDMVISNLMLQWCDDLPQVFTGINRILAPNGLLTFTTFGPDTLRELRESWSKVDHYEHTSTFQDMHDVGDALMQAGFQQPVVDMETITLTYTSLTALMKDLKNIGASNAASKRNKGLTG
ncbi:MAG: malonyl-ACP O-methyltransferase BioC, partial [Thiotrichaceae bacterium]